MERTQWKWEETYLQAFLETSPLNLPNRVADAERAIPLRTIELRTSSSGELEWPTLRC
jgi:hypothetical protein